MFKKLFAAFSKSEPVHIDMAKVKADMHSHLIPAIDDGSKSIEDSLQLIKALMDMGYTKLVTTPHIMQDTYRNGPETILGGLEKVKAALKEAHMDIEIEAAAEYYLDEHFESRLENDQLLTFGKNYLLFEVSFMHKPMNMEACIFKMNTMSIRPVLAHPERYIFMHSKNLDQYEKLKDMGCLFQVNLPSLVGAYSKEVRDVGRKLIEAEMVELVGSDLHNMTQTGIVQVALKDKYLAKLINSGKLLNATL